MDTQDSRTCEPLERGAGRSQEAFLSSLRISIAAKAFSKIWVGPQRWSCSKVRTLHPGQAFLPSASFQVLSLNFSLKAHSC